VTDDDLRTEAAGGPVPDDPAARADALWQRGDWDALAEADEAWVETHPQRLRTALMLATAHQQRGDGTALRRWVARARDWGATDAQLARWLLGGVHDTLGRAAAALAQPLRAGLHFHSAVGLGTSATSTRSAWQVRAASQCARLGLAPPDGGAAMAEAMPVPRPHPLAQALERVEQAAERLAQRHEALDALEAGLKKDMTALRKSIEATVRQEIANMARQVEAHADVLRHLDSDRLLPPLHGWAVSPDFARHLLALIEARDYDLVVEFGSGTSTVLVSLALQRDARRGRKGVPRLLSFEHDKDYHRQTTALLQAAGVAGVGTLVHARLRPWTAGDGRHFRFYDCDDALAAAAAQTAEGRQRLLVIVDGPPAATGAHARYPALPLLLAHFARARFDLLIDDYKRSDEKEMVRMWLDEFERNGFRADATEIELEKQGCLVRATPPGEDGAATGRPE
jgi:predicted O-methyltransferase YrrM